MQNLDPFLARLLPSVQGCPDPLARQVLIDAAIEFCDETLLVRAFSPAQAASAGTRSYTIDIPITSRVVAILRAWYGGRELLPAPDSMISAAGAYEDGPAAPGTPQYFHEGAAGEVTLYPTPQAGDLQNLTLYVATKPVRTATQLDDVLLHDWVEAVVYGARARLHAMPDVAFSSPGQAQSCFAAFRHFINRARAEAQRGRIRGSISVVPRAFA